MVKFIWDEKKNRINIKKHGVDFCDAKHSSHTEIRWIYLGAVARVVLFVVETESDKDTVRIISARKALKHEQEAYYANRSKNS